ncbi:DUF1501 domain-containing protein [Taibaiella chishuiensis]|uniref:Uncharacterized protein (DUF1501 family) n=1 Tax=Taibaiella chishuiensis TaxID=1434707 RepID=A0A2P8CV94_9BACT|nr:DUF1501 domain-containing protein [Taibaiella chishuiensis]PSK88876.1 uncharacterized protein (DUF1501 family) [Taibaiella chishuiensis]
MQIGRRSFIKTGVLATTALLVPRFLRAFEGPAAGIVPPGNKVLVVLQLSGGNDGLNTLIPVRNDNYYRMRPTLGMKMDRTLLLNDETGLHPELSHFKALYDEGHLAILNEVGYPNPDRSHFRSMDIWQSASESSEVWQTGWLGRYLDEACQGCARPTQALEIDDTLSLALKGELEKAIALKDPKLLYNNSHKAYLQSLSEAHNKMAHAAHHEQPVDYLYKTMTGTLSSAQYIFEESKAVNSTVSYPKTELGKNMKTIASLILSDINTQVYYVSVGSFDTHTNQQAQQARLFKQINEALAAFTGDLKANNRFDDVLVFTFSEFGRRVAENASGGTDHGTANCMFFAGGGLKEKGLLNALPDLQGLKDGDLQYKVDFKQVYATVLKQWLGADDRRILGKQMDYLSFI